MWVGNAALLDLDRLALRERFRFRSPRESLGALETLAVGGFEPDGTPRWCTVGARLSGSDGSHQRSPFLRWEARTEQALEQYRLLSWVAGSQELHSMQRRIGTSASSINAAERIMKDCKS